MKFTLTKVSKLGEPHAKYGQRYWVEADGADLPLSFSTKRELAEGDVIDGTTVETESSKGTPYLKFTANKEGQAFPDSKPLPKKKAWNAEVTERDHYMSRGQRWGNSVTNAVSLVTKYHEGTLETALDLVKSVAKELNDFQPEEDQTKLDLADTKQAIEKQLEDAGFTGARIVGGDEEEIVG